MYHEIMDRINSVADKAQYRIQSEYDDWMDLYHASCGVACSMENNGHNVETEQDCNSFNQKYLSEVIILENKYEELLHKMV